MTKGEVRGGVEQAPDGKFVDKFGDDEVVEVLASAYPEPMTNGEVADAIDSVKATAHNRLHDLHEEGVVETKKVGARARVWWVDMTKPAPEVARDSLRELLTENGLDRDDLIQLASRFGPPWNPTRTGTDEMIEWLLGREWYRITRALEDHLEADDAGA